MFHVTIEQEVVMGCIKPICIFPMPPVMCIHTAVSGPFTSFVLKGKRA